METMKYTVTRELPIAECAKWVILQNSLPRLVNNTLLLVDPKDKGLPEFVL